MTHLAQWLRSASVGILLCSPVLAAPGPVPPVTPNDRLLQQELKQQQIRNATLRVADQLAAVIAEFDRNQIVGEDVKTLKAVRSVLGALSEKDMQLVVEFLREAREATDSAAGARRATEAFARQKAIVLQLQQLLAEYERQHRLYVLSVRFRELSRRQTDVMRGGVRLAEKTEGKSLSSFNEEEKNALRLQQIEQDTLKPEVLLRAGELDRLTREFIDGPAAERPKAALKQVREGNMLPALDTATAALVKGLMLSAAGDQRRARNEMREVARLLLLSEDQATFLRQALHEVEEALDQQRAVTEETRKVDTKETASDTEKEQAEVVDNTDLVQRDVNGIAPAAAEQLRKAYDEMTDAREALMPRDKPQTKPSERRAKALPLQENALASLDQARRALQEQLEKAEQFSGKPENTLAGLKELQEQIRELIEQEKQHKEQTATAQKKDLSALAPKQGELKDRTQDAQQRAATATPDAADSLRDAASQMQKAQTALADAKNNPEAQQAAIDALQQADRQLGQEITKLEQAEKDLAKLDELSEKIEGIIQNQQKLEFNTAKEAARNDATPLKDLASRQGALKTETGALKQEASEPVPAAAAHLGEATNQMASAKAELDKPSARTAQPRQSEALTDLHAAKKEIDKKAAALRDMLGLPQGIEAQSLADAQSAIEQAQQQVNEALTDMQQNQPPGVLEALQQRQQQIADALEQKAQGTQTAARLNQAQQAASQAAQQLAQRNLPKAVDAMQAAQDAMQQAQPGKQGDPAGQSLQEQNEQQGEGQQGEQGQQGQGQKGQGTPSTPQLARQQADVKKEAEALMAAMQSTPGPSMQQASQHLEQAGNTVGPVTAGQMGALPMAAQAALQSAEQAMAQGMAQASASENPQAQASAAAAQQSLAQAQAALALAQAGMNSQAGQQGQQPGQGQNQGKGQAQGQGQGQGQQPGQGKGQAQGRQPGQGQPSPRGDGRMGNWAGAGGAQGPRRATDGASGFLNLPKRDRAALMQSQAEKYPQEYGPAVEQYLKNLSDQSGEK